MKIQLSLLIIFLLSPLVNGQAPDDVPENFKVPELPKLTKIPTGKVPKTPGLSKAEQKVYKDAEDVKRNDYILIAKFIESEYIAKAVVKIAKLEKQIKFLKTKMGKIGISKKAIAKYKKEITRLTALQEAEKLWAVYNKAYVLKGKAYNNKEFKRAGELSTFIKEVKTKYKDLTQFKFPPITTLFYSKYKNKLPELRKKYLK